MNELNLNPVFLMDYQPYNLTPLEQLICIRIYYFLYAGESFSLTTVAGVCNCTRQAVYGAVSKLVGFGFFSSSRRLGKPTVYTVNKDKFPSVIDDFKQQEFPKLQITLSDEDFLDIPGAEHLASGQAEVVQSELSGGNDSRDDVSGNFISLDDASVDSLLLSGHEPTHLVSRHCAPSNIKRSQARKKRKKRK